MPGDRADHIFLGSLDGKSVTQLTAGDANDGTPECSPDGSLIVFARDRTYQWGGLAANWTDRVLCVMSIDGTALRQLTNDDWMASAPHFSPDGEYILFSAMGGPYTIATDGSGSPRSVGDLNGRDAVYAPDGQSVAFSMGRYSPDQRIFVARADGSRLKMVAHPSGEPGVHPRGGCTRPAFTHDGKRLFFFEESWPDGPTGDPKESLWEIDLEAGKLRQIAGHGLFDNPLNWRPELPKPAEGP